MCSAHRALISGPQMHHINACIFLVARTKTQTFRLRFCYGDEENARIYAVHLTTANQRQDVQSAILSLCKLVDSKWAWREIGKRKNPRRGRRKREASEKAHPGSLLLGCGEKSGRGEKVASGKTHDVGVEKEKQARKPTLEACR